MLLLLLVVVALCGSPTLAMIWHPKNPAHTMWDTWLFAQPAGAPKYYMNYLASCNASGAGPRVDGTGGWAGVGATISQDGVHYEDQGVVIHKHPDAVWLGSGSVLQNSAGEYVMNFSEEYDCQPAKNGAKYGTGCQSIFFATSKDLRNWTRLPFKAPPADDPEVFKYSDGGLAGKTPGYTVGGRWDCIATVPKPGSPGIFYGFWTASPTGHGGAGVGETTDQTGHHWKALPPITEGFPKGEVGSTVALNGKYYMLFGGGRIYSSDHPIHGYKADPNNWEFHTDGGGVAFSRLWNVHDGNSSTVLLSHQWMSNNRAMGSRGIYLGPLKEMQVGADGTPRVIYWAGNEKLKGERITLPQLAYLAPRRQRVLQRHSEGYMPTKVVSAPSTAHVLDVVLDLTVGVVVEATLSCAARTNTTAGLLVSGSATNGTFVWNCATQTFSLLGGQPIDRKLAFPPGAPVALKMLLRTTPDGETCMAEFYANKIMSHPVTFALGGGQAAKLAVLDLTPHAAHELPLLPVQDLKVWKMTLEAE